MEVTDLLCFRTREEFREWLLENHHCKKFCWITTSRGSIPDAVPYLDAVEEALCFGWIDGTMKKLDDGKLVQRFSPRTKNSNWTELNKERARRLEKLGMMTEAGRRILPDLDAEFEIHPIILDALMEDALVYENFLNFPELYRKVHIYNMHHPMKMNEEEIFEKRLKKFIESTRENKMYGDWNDNGRLIDY